MSPEEYRRFKEIARKAFAATVAAIQAKNPTAPEDEVMADVTKVVEDARQERY
jgi:hypothetical protein